MTGTTILAIDLGKYKCVACTYDRATAVAEFRTITTSRAEVERLIRTAGPAVVVIEACSLAGWVHDLCAELRIPCQVANTAAEAWKYKHAKRKTDRDDALRLAQLCALGQLPEVVVPAKPVREWRALIAHRQALVGQRVAAQNRIRAVLVGQGLPAPRGARAWTATGLAGIAQFARPLAECPPDELWRGMLDLALTAYRQAEELVATAEARLDQLGKADRRVRLLETVPGLGPRTAEAVVAHLDDPKRFQRQAGGGLRRAGAAAVPVRRGRPAGPDHQARPGGAAQAAGPVRLGDAAVQPVGAGGVRAAQPGQGAAEAGGGGAGPQGAGEVLGDAAGRAAVAGRPGAGGGRGLRAVRTRR